MPPVSWITSFGNAEGLHNSTHAKMQQAKTEFLVQDFVAGLYDHLSALVLAQILQDLKSKRSHSKDRFL